MAGEIEDDDVKDDEVEDDYDVSLSENDSDDFDDDEVDLDEELDASPKEIAARALEIRRALEVRDEQRRLSEDLDYLEFDDE
ncbi:MAG: hypothetical protein E2O54_09235 [Gammaproteobacteria bacterium]|nr:MAG: hypothetical protein E2O58_09685 [Gammaproteobacteria bacterium]TDJ39961.1 MAG: hypothetical protein E2O54_09235 [Gammaproteobacteria bacterium]TDJ46533.1 MAG: hypothetical protein E2O48_04785 [Gemmatimonadota bacterium]